MKIKPINNRILVKYILSKSPNLNIIIPEKSIERSNEGIIMEIGDKASKNIKIGDHIIFNRYSGESFNFDNQEFLFIKEEDILGVIKF